MRFRHLDGSRRTDYLAENPAVSRHYTSQGADGTLAVREGRLDVEEAGSGLRVIRVPLLPLRVQDHRMLKVGPRMLWLWLSDGTFLAIRSSIPNAAALAWSRSLGVSPALDASLVLRSLLLAHGAELAR